MDLLSAKIICQADAGAFPVCIFGVSAFPIEELKRVKLRFTLKGNRGHFSMGCHGRYWHPFNAESLLCALVHRVFLASLLHGKLSFCPRFPWKSWPPSHDPAALLWARSACWDAFTPLSPCCLLCLWWQQWELCAWLCLQIWPLAACSPVLLTAGEIIQNIQRDVAVCSE